MRAPTTWFRLLCYLIPSALFVVFTTYAVYRKIKIERSAGRELTETLKNESPTMTGSLWLDAMIFLLVMATVIAGLLYYIQKMKELV